MAQQDQPEVGGTGLGHRSVTMTRSEKGTYLVTNARGGTLSVGGGGECADFPAVGLFLTSGPSLSTSRPGAGRCVTASGTTSVTSS